MGESIVSPLVGSIIESLSSSVFEELVAVRYVIRAELENLTSILTASLSVLHDAEEKQRRNQAIKRWLRKLKHAAYDVQDWVDDFTIETRRHLQQRGLKNRVRSLLSPDHNQTYFQVKMAHKLKIIRENINAIATQRDGFHLREAGGNRENEVMYRSRMPTSSLVYESVVYGRDKEKEELINKLLTSSDDLSVYAVCGMGGLGKTALAQLVYNDEKVTQLFDLRIWVCVSDDVSMRRLITSIIESIERSPCYIAESDPLLQHLQHRLSGKKFLLVLDDVWDSLDYSTWNVLKTALMSGAKGSSIVITTRSETVALQMATYVQHMGRLSDDDSWSLFRRYALGEESKEDVLHLEVIGKEIVKKCDGVPLAIKALGGLLRVKRSEIEWLSVKESELWDLEGEGSILPVLRLSYDYLNPQLKQCFAFCSIFPKDYVMEKDQLISLWIASGFIPHNRRTHGVGEGIFCALVARSFFQDVKDDGLGNISCKMHDLMHDLALSIMRDDCCLIKDKEPADISSTVYHVTFIGRYPSRDDQDLLRVQKLRSLFLLDGHGSKRYRSDALHSYLLKHKYLKTLKLGNFKFEQLPASIVTLRHLTYLDVSDSSIEALPESISSFQNLQTLNLSRCQYLQMLPKNMKHMKNLTYLDITCCNGLRCMPAEMGQLTRLHKLSMFIVGKEDGHYLGELEGLNYLMGELSIKDLDNVKNFAEAKSAKIWEKSLQSLSLSWRVDNSGNMDNSEEVLLGLQPHSNLKKLILHGYRGPNFPTWMLELPNLVEISLEWCANCERLPNFGKLQFLKKLCFRGMDNVKCFDSDVYGDGERPFPSLESLTFSSMPNLAQWAIMAGRESFPILRELTVCHCPKLDGFPNISSVRTLKIRSSSVVLLRSVMNFTSLTSFHIESYDELTLPHGLLQNHTLLENLEIVGLSSLKSLSNQLDNLSALKCLHIQWCDELESLPRGLQNLKSLETLYIDRCRRLSSLPVNGLCGLSSLRNLSIRSCGRLTSLSEGLTYLTALEDLYLDRCSELNSLPEDIQNLTSLRSLRIWNCDGLYSLPNQIGYHTSLSQLWIEGCANLMSLPGGVGSLYLLKNLYINNCPYLERRCKKLMGEDWPKISHIPCIFINGELI